MKKNLLLLGLLSLSFLLALPTAGGYIGNLTVVYFGIVFLVVYVGILSLINAIQFGYGYMVIGFVVSLLMGMLTYLFYGFAAPNVWAEGSAVGQVAWALAYVTFRRSLKMKPEMYNALIVGFFALMGNIAPEYSITGKVLGGTFSAPLTLINVPLSIAKWFFTCVLQVFLYVIISNLKKHEEKYTG